MTDIDIDFVDIRPGEQVKPITQFSEENIRAIPLGSEIVIVNFGAATIEAGIWGEDIRDGLIATVAEHGREVTEADLILLQVPVLDTPETIVRAVLTDWSLALENRSDLGDVPRNYSIPPQQFAEILLDVAQRAQRQKKFDPEDPR